MNDNEDIRFSRPTVVVIAIQAAVLAAVLLSAQPMAKDTQQAADLVRTELAMNRIWLPPTISNSSGSLRISPTTRRSL
jgi:hypothetical protein